MSERVLAIDPGERVGWAAGTVDDGVTDITQGVHALMDFAVALDRKLDNSAKKLDDSGGGVDNYDVIVYETWRLYPAMARKMVGNDMQPAQLVGIIRFLARKHGVRLVSQGANIKEIAMKSMPEYIKQRMVACSEQHDKDALMHLWYYAFKRRTSG